MQKFVVLGLLVSFLTSCENSTSPSENVVFDRIDLRDSGVDFTNTLTSSDEFNVFKYRNFYNGGGVGIGDINNDGLSDIYLVGNQTSNKLFLNKGDFKFEDITESAGIAGTRAWSTGISMVDINNDGLLDLYVTNAGYLEGDDHANELFINQGDLTFKEAAREYGLDDSGYTTHAAFFDYDLDGDLDAYVLNNSFIPVNSLNYSGRRDLYADDWPVKDFVKGGGDKLLRNDDGRFVDVSEEAGIYGSLIGFGLGITVGDLNEDGYLDIYVSNDFFERDYLYINQRNGKFEEEITNWMGHISLSSMGADMADINNDGFPEIFVTEMLPDNDKKLKTTSNFEAYNMYLLKQQRGFYHQYMHNTLQLNNGNNTFSEISWFSGVSASDWSWGALMFDADNDGLKDLYISNGIERDVTNQDFIDFFANEVIQDMVTSGEKEEVRTIIEKMPSNKVPNKFFRNNGNLKFEDRGIEFGLNEPSFSNGSAYGDLDNDGDLDLVVNNVNDPAFVYRNNSEKNGSSSISIKLQGDKKNAFGIGSKIVCYVGFDKITTDMMPTRGFQSSVDYKLVIGLGKTPVVDSLEIIWPDGKFQKLYNQSTDTLLSLYYTNAKSSKDYSSDTESSRTFFEEVETDLSALPENQYVDFFQEGLLIKELSKEGPIADIGDVNGDGLDDIFIGGPSNQAGRLYMQNRQGAFDESYSQIFKSLHTLEDTYVKFFDVDGDGDLDLFVGSGGNDITKDENSMGDRIYLNNGSGEFSHHKDAFPYNSFNTSVAVPIDFDDDGDLDLFVGSRSFPGAYGVSPHSYLYRNDGTGRFDDLTARFLPALRKVGMITDATLADLNSNGKQELILVGEWMAPSAFEFNGNKLAPLDIGLADYKGWWYAISVQDLDNDGDEDLVLGNRGENFYFSATMQNPVKLWLKDFDNNGTMEKIVTRTINGKDKPIAMKRELTAQLPNLKKENLRHEAYAEQGMRDLFSSEMLEGVEIKESTWFKSIVALNDGAGNFNVTELPNEVQFSCVYDIDVRDINDDNYPDLIMGGNDSGFQPQFSKLDASFGHVLLNDQSGGFEWISNKESGFFVRGDIKKIIGLTIQNTAYILVTRSEEKPVLFKLLEGK